MSWRSSRPIQGHGRLGGSTGRVELRDVPFLIPVPIGHGAQGGRHTRWEQGRPGATLAVLVRRAGGEEE